MKCQYCGGDEQADLVCQMEGEDKLIIEAEGSISGVLRAAAYEIDQIGRKVFRFGVWRRPDGTVRAIFVFKSRLEGV